MNFWFSRVNMVFYIFLEVVFFLRYSGWIWLIFFSFNIFLIGVVFFFLFLKNKNRLLIIINELFEFYFNIYWIFFLKYELVIEIYVFLLYIGSFFCLLVFVCFFCYYFLLFYISVLYYLYWL